MYSPCHIAIRTGTRKVPKKLVFVGTLLEAEGEMPNKIYISLRDFPPLFDLQRFCEA